jgi:hypothetical protein
MATSTKSAKAEQDAEAAALAAAEENAGMIDRSEEEADHSEREPEQEQPAPEAKPEITVEIVQVPYHRPTVVLTDGSKIVCEHPYLHEQEKAAMACGRRMAAAGAFVK